MGWGSGWGRALAFVICRVLIWVPEPRPRANRVERKAQGDNFSANLELLEDAAIEQGALFCNILAESRRARGAG